MANHKSARKRASQNERRRLRNKAVKTKVKTAIKNFSVAANSKSTNEITKALNTAKSIIDNAAKKGVLHKKNASRKISRLSKRVNTIDFLI